MYSWYMGYACNHIIMVWHNHIATVAVDEGCGGGDVGFGVSLGQASTGKGLGGVYGMTTCNKLIGDN